MRQSGTRSASRGALVDLAPRVLGAFPEDLSHEAESKLREKGVEVRLGVKVRGVDNGGITLQVGATTELCHPGGFRRLRVRFDHRDGICHAWNSLGASVVFSWNWCDELRWLSTRRFC
jgi:hypothetical protein